MHMRQTLGLNEAKAATDTMLEHAKQVGGRPIAIAVTDDRGELIYFIAQAGVNAALARQNAFKKAYTAACMRADTRAFEERVRNSGGSVRDFGNANFFAGGGGAVVVAMNGTILGGLGVSGRTDQEDEDIVQVGIGLMRSMLEQEG